MSLIDGIRHLFSHDDHCEVHAIYQPDCEACQLIRQRHHAYVDTPDPIDTNQTFDGSSDTPSIFVSSPDTGSIDTGSADFGGFDGGNSGGGGSSGDF